MKNKSNIKKAKQLVLSLVLSFLCLNIVAQNPPKLYPYGDEFPLGLYGLNTHFSTVSSQDWNNGHVYNYYTDTNGVIHNHVHDWFHSPSSNTSLNHNQADTVQHKTPMPDKYFQVCANYNMCAKGRLSTNRIGGIYQPVADAIVIAEINQQSANTNLSWWDIPEEMRWWEVTEDTIFKRYSRYVRKYDPERRPNYMYLPGHYFQNFIAKYVADLDIVPVSCYAEYSFVDYTWEQRGLPHSYIRWAIERTQKAIIEPTANNLNGFKIGKDYLNGEKTVTAILEMFRNTAFVTIEDSLGNTPAIDFAGNEIDTLRLDNIELNNDGVIETIKNYLIAPWSNSNTSPQGTTNNGFSIFGWKIKDKIFDHKIEEDHTWHDFWLALACDVQGIEVFAYHYGGHSGLDNINNTNSTYGHLGYAWNKLNDAVTIFKDNNLDKVQLNGIIDNTIEFNLLSGPDSTEFFRFEPTQGNYEDIQYPSIKLQAKKWMGDTYIIAVNSTDSTVVYDMPISTMGNQNGVPLVVENLIDNTSQTLTSNFYGGILTIKDTLPPLGVSVFKYKSATTLDLSMRDCLNDNGYDAGYRQDLEDIDNSPDIWVRRSNNGFTNQNHQAPQYSLTDSTNYVYVRVTNISSEPSSGNEILKLYWTKNGMHPTWPIMWDGSHPDPTMGGLVDAINIPVLQSGDTRILEFEWNIVRDNDTIGGTDWGHCLLARIENTGGKDEIQDYFKPNSNTEHWMSKEIFMNNNIASRNCNIINVPILAALLGNHHLVHKTLDLGNSSSLGDFYDITFQVPQFFRTSSLMNNITVSVQFDAQGWNLFQNSINNAEGLSISGERKITLTGFETTLEDVYLPANTQLPATLTFDCLIQNDSTAEYEFLVSSQTSIADDNGEYWRGNVRYVVNNNPRDPFDADAGDDKEIDRGESTLLCAELINEAAIYNWYDMEGNLIYTGTDLSISPEVSKRYRLEVIATVDGLTCYDEVDVEVNPYFITGISPNPASTIVTIDYFAEGASSAYIMLLSYTNGTANNHIINTTSTQTNINIANYPTGIYSVILVCDGVHYTIENLVVQ